MTVRSVAALCMAAAGACSAPAPTTCEPAIYDPAVGLAAPLGRPGPVRSPVESFLDTTVTVAQAAAALDGDLTSACTALGTALGIAATELAPLPERAGNPGAASDAACSRTRREIDSIIKQAVPQQAYVTVVALPTRCALDPGAFSDCLAACTAAAVPAGAVRCRAGATAGGCSGACTGSCQGSCATGCAGRCTGTCAGTCDGRCEGACMGTCSATDAGSGACLGRCTGSCQGRCSGTCTGSCDAACAGTCAAPCTGSCAGTCPAWSGPADCDDLELLSPAPDCEPSCQARVRAQGLCGAVTLVAGVAATVPAAAKARVDALVAALGAHYPAVLAAAYRASAVLKNPVTTFQASLPRQSELARQAGGRAPACVAVAAPVLAAALGLVNQAVTLTAALESSLAIPGAAP